MEKQMKLRVHLKEAKPGIYEVIGEHYDGQPFTFFTSEHNVILSDQEDSSCLMGWVVVVEYAKQGDRCAITLPNATIDCGRNVSVKDLKLMPIVANLSMLGMKKF